MNKRAISTPQPALGYISNVYRFTFSHLYNLLMRKGLAFFFVLLYVFFEYVRPQQIYEWMDVAPWPLISLSLATGLTLMEGRLRFGSRRIWLLVVAFTAVILLSSITAVSPSVSWAGLSLWVNWLLLMLIIGAGIHRRDELYLFLVAFGLWNIKMTQFGVRAWFRQGFSFRATGVSGGPGWFQNSGEFGIEMCVFLPLAAYFAIGLWPSLSRAKRILLVAVASSALISMVVSSSRGALIGAAAIGLWFTIKSKARVKALTTVAVVSAIVWVVVPAESKARFSEMGEDSSSVSRLTYWKDAIEITNEHPLLGIGFRNWIPYYRARYNPTGELPHNFLLECSSELGYVGLAVLLALIFSVFAENAAVRRRCAPTGTRPDRFLFYLAHGIDGAMIGFMVSGSFVTVLFYPYLWMNIAICLAASAASRDTSVPAKSRSAERPNGFVALRTSPLGSTDHAARVPFSNGEGRIT